MAKYKAKSWGSRKDEKVSYYCTKCKKKHRLNTKIGKGHTDYLGYK